MAEPIPGWMSSLPNTPPSTLENVLDFDWSSKSVSSVSCIPWSTNAMIFPAPCAGSRYKHDLLIVLIPDRLICNQHRYPPVLEDLAIVVDEGFSQSCRRSD
jgi:hypothetical protein